RAPKKAASASAPADAIATPGASSPLATGRLRFRGWARSASTSATSFTRYTALAAAQKSANAEKVRAADSASRRLFEKTSGARTKRFFTHCLGRIARMRANAMAGGESTEI